MDWENHLEKNPTQKIEKTLKIEVKFPHESKKPQANFLLNIDFSLYFKLRVK